MRTVAIIPSRAGSKRIPSKNLSDVCGLPMLQWTLAAARHAAAIDSIYCLTDCADAIEVCRRVGVRVIGEPAELATDGASLDDAVAWALTALPDPIERGDITVLLQPTSPLRSFERINEAVATYVAEADCDTVVGVTRDPGAHFTWRRGASGMLYADYSGRPRTQDIDLYRETGAIYVRDSRAYVETKCRIGNVVRPIVMDAWEATDVDTPDDLAIARFWMTKQIFRRTSPFLEAAGWRGSEP